MQGRTSKPITHGHTRVAFYWRICSSSKWESRVIYRSRHSAKMRHDFSLSNAILAANGEKMLEQVFLDLCECLLLFDAVIPCLGEGIGILDIVVASVELDLTECLLCCAYCLVCCFVAFPQVFVACAVQVDCWCGDVHSIISGRLLILMFQTSGRRSCQILVLRILVRLRSTILLQVSQ